MIQNEKSLAKEIAEKIIQTGYEITKEDALLLYKTADLQELRAAADQLRENFLGNKVDMCSVINARQGGCPENCKYCSQSAWNKGCPRTPFVRLDDAIEYTKNAISHKIDYIAIVTAGRALTGSDFEAALKMIRELNARFRKQIKFCACMGLLEKTELLALKEAGISRYDHNLETSERFFPNICTSHTYRERYNTAKAAKEAGLEICCGGIIGMGEGVEDRVDWAAALRELDSDSVPVNILIPMPETPFENLVQISKEDVLRTLAILRFFLPKKGIRIAAGRKALGENGIEALTGGANSMISGALLTAPGTDNDEDLQMLKNLEESRR